MTVARDSLTGEATTVPSVLIVIADKSASVVVCIVGETIGDAIDTAV